MVEVLTGRIADIPGRELHRMRTHTAGGAPTRIRDDRAVAMRCNLKTNSPSAPRLMWWKLPDSTVELGRVAAHDDTQLR
ncbi:hypothetical protein AB0I22_13555 [Streptomyces sp. NPDC050610]|uniref:hypothetical protein n=1 Tax=Streptomyces sp. NPDC050610 TaxID=3157097 RepID=UPI003427ABDF